MKRDEAISNQAFRNGVKLISCLFLVSNFMRAFLVWCEWFALACLYRSQCVFESPTISFRCLDIIDLEPLCRQHPFSWDFTARNGDELGGWGAYFWWWRWRWWWWWWRAVSWLATNITRCTLRRAIFNTMPSDLIGLFSLSVGGIVPKELYAEPYF